MAQQFNQPSGRRRGGVYDKDSGGSKPGFLTPGLDGDVSGGDKVSLGSDRGTSLADKGDGYDGPDSSYSGGEKGSSALSGKDLSGLETKGSTGAAGDRSDGLQTKSDQDEKNELDGFFKPEDGKRRLRGNIFASKRNRWIGAGIGGSIAGIGMFGFFLLPLKVMHIAENLQDTFFSSTEEASDEMTNRLLGDYLIKHVMPGMTGTCTSTLKVNKSCAVVNEDENNPVAILYRTWRDQNLEGQMAKKYGLEIRREGGKYYVRKGGHDLFPGVERTDTNQKLFEDKMFAAMDRKDVRKELLKATENETFYKRVMYRFKYGAFIQRKYGVVRCVIACDYRNDRVDRKEMRKLRFQFWFIDRITGPRTEMYATAFKCALGGFECTKPDSYDTGEDGDRRSQLERDVRASVGTAIGDGRYSQEKLDNAKKRADGIRSKGVSGQLVEELVGKLAGETSGKVAGSSLPVIGWIDSAVRIFQAVKDAGPALKTMNYVINSQAFVQLYTMYRSNADEIKDGRILAEDTSYVGESLGDNYGTDQMKGSAESSPYYQDVMGSRGVKTASLFPKAEAASVYKCNDGSSITTGLCPEMSLSTVSGAAKIAGGASDFLNSGPLAPVGVAADVWSSTIGSVFDFFSGALGSLADNLVPQIIKDKAGEIIASVGQWFISKVVNDPIGKSPSGGRMFDMAAMGANVAGNDYAHYGLGAGKISDQEANDLMIARANEEQQDFSRKSFFARMFDTSSSYSMVSRLALSTPTGSDTSRSFATSLLNPFSTLSASLPSAKKVGANPIKNLDFGGVTQYGYASNDEVFKQTDYMEYWKNNDCDDEEKVKAWAESAKISEENGMPVNDAPYRCKLIQSIALSNCGYYNDDCLTPEELGTADENVCTTQSGVKVEGMPSWVKMPVVNAQPGGPVNGTVRMAVANIQQHPDVAPGVRKLTHAPYNLDFIGLNEVGDTSLQEMEGASDGQFGAYRDPNIEGTSANGGGQRSMDNAIMWRKDKWSFVDGGRVKITEDDKAFYNGSERTWDRWAAWAIFKNKSTGAVIPVIVAHAMTNPAKYPRQWGDPPLTRIQQYALSMNILTKLVSTLSPYGPVLVAGDMNAQDWRGDWSAVPKMKAAGFDYVSDGAVVYIFHPKGTKASNVRIDASVKTPHDSHAGALIADFDMNGAGPGGVGTEGSVGISADGSCEQASSVDYKNPVYGDGTTPDPSVIRADDGTYHLFATSGVHLTSKDLVNWKKDPKGWNLQGEPALPGTDRWGPNVVKIGSKYVLTFVYAIGLPETGGYGASRIAYAVADNVDGPYRYKAVLNLPGSGLEIAPQIYAEGSKSWLVWGGGFFDINEVKLEGEQLKLVGGSTHLLTKGGVGSPNATIESPWISKHDGWYYLTYSQGHWNIKDGPPNYRVLVARSKNVTGPYSPDNSMKPILEGKDPIKNPGSHTIATDDAGNDWILYGAFYGNDKTGRKLMLDPIFYKNGWLVVDGPSSTTRKGPMIGGLDQTSGSGNFAWPISKSDYVPLSNCYAKPSGGRDGHTGIDIPVNNKPVLAAADGTVVATGGPSGAAGNYIMIKHSGGKWTNYQHLSSKKVSVGDHVKQGDVIGVSGNTGNVRGDNGGYHLHFGITTQQGLDGLKSVSISVNPLDFLPKDRDLGVCK